MDKNGDVSSHVEDIDMVKQQASSNPNYEARGTVKLLDENTIILIPTPSPDPKGTPAILKAQLSSY
jgi:hypothetical protein